jgi:aryl-alcohol dehydrogenase
MRIEAAVVREAGGDFVMEELDLASPRVGELLVQVKACGICGTDEAARQQHAPVPLPAVLGHEGAGVVLEVGEGVMGFMPGDHVCFSFNSCGHCDFCAAGKPYRCEHSTELNFGGFYADGSRRLSKQSEAGKEEFPAFFGQSAFARYAVVNQRGAVRISKTVPFEYAAPMGCGLQTGAGTVFNVFKPAFGESLAVFGLGAVGFAAIMAARIMGLSPIVAIGGNEHKLALARELGATHTINRRAITGEDTATALVAEIRANSAQGVHYSIDTSGNANLLRAALSCLRPDGTLAVMAPSEPFTLDLFADLIDTTRTITGVMEGSSIPQLLIPQLLNSYQAGRFPVDRLVSTYAFSEINQAFADLTAGRVIKAVLTMDERSD